MNCSYAYDQPSARQSGNQASVTVSWNISWVSPCAPVTLSSHLTDQRHVADQRVPDRAAAATLACLVRSVGGGREKKVWRFF
jgi:hypothetical protein